MFKTQAVFASCSKKGFSAKSYSHWVFSWLLRSQHGTTTRSAWCLYLIRHPRLSRQSSAILLHIQSIGCHVLYFEDAKHRRRTLPLLCSRLRYQTASVTFDAMRRLLAYESLGMTRAVSLTSLVRCKSHEEWEMSNRKTILDGKKQTDTQTCSRAKAPARFQ